MKHNLPKLTSARHGRANSTLVVVGLFIVALAAIVAVRQPWESAPAFASSDDSGAGQGSGAKGQSANGQQLVAESARRLLAESSIRANVRFRVAAFEHEVTGVGNYLQLGQGPEKLLRFEMKAQAGDKTVAMQEVCSEDDYWIRRDVGQVGAFVGRASLRPIRQAIAKRTKNPAVDPIQSWILLGGLPRMMEEIGRNFQFEQAEASELEFASADGKGTERMPVWIVRGKLNDDRLKHFLNGKTIKPGANLPDQITTNVELVLGRSEQTFPLFPYRITYLRPDAPANGEAAEDMQRAGELVEFMKLEFYGVYHTTGIDPREFAYDPGDQEVADLTQGFLNRLGLATPK